MNLFIDTNIYLTFYHYSSDDLEELKKLAVAIKSGNISLYLTQQVKDEFRRNRESKIADALKRLVEQKLGTQFPQICKEYPEYRELREAIKHYDDNKDRILQKLSSDIEARNLGADKVIADLFSKAKLFGHDDKIFVAARTRMMLGNPPGKDGSYGDAVNWETLLKKMPKEQLFLITDDRDYMSQVNDTRLGEFLLEEWQDSKGAGISLYRKLSDFFRDKFPTIKLASELEKELAISELSLSGNFQRTHSTVAKLSQFTDFTDDELNAIVDAAITNNQVYWISEDPDVRAFMQNLVQGRENVIEPKKFETFKSHYLSDPEAALQGEEELEF